MPEVDDAGVRTYYAEHGDGEPVVLLHGGIMGGDSWPADARAGRALPGARARRASPPPSPPRWRMPTRRHRAGPASHDTKRKKKGCRRVAHKILLAACHVMATPGEVYRDLAPTGSIGPRTPAAHRPPRPPTRSSRPHRNPYTSCLTAALPPGRPHNRST